MDASRVAEPERAAPEPDSGEPAALLAGRTHPVDLPTLEELDEELRLRSARVAELAARMTSERARLAPEAVPSESGPALEAERRETRDDDAQDAGIDAP